MVTRCPLFRRDGNEVGGAAFNCEARRRGSKIEYLLKDYTLDLAAGKSKNRGYTNLMQPPNLQLVYTLLCDDVRIEMGNKISLMGICQNIMVEKLPISIIKFGVLNHFRGDGRYNTEVRILAPDRTNLIVTSQPTEVELTPGGFTDNVSFFVNVMFPTAGTYWVQTLADTVVLDEVPLIVADAASMTPVQTAEEVSGRVN